jgi:hypothetical protein
MNRYIMIRRLRCPAFLLLLGVLALLNQAGILGWGKSWPFFLILAGLLILAERAALTKADYPQAPYPGSYSAPNPSPNSEANFGATSAAGQSSPDAPFTSAAEPVVVTYEPPPPTPPSTQSDSAIVLSPTHDLEKYSNGGQS